MTKGECKLSVERKVPFLSLADFHSKKVLLPIWWDLKGVLYYELLPPNQSVNSEKSCLQLNELKAAIARISKQTRCYLPPP